MCGSITGSLYPDACFSQLSDVVVCRGLTLGEQELEIIRDEIEAFAGRGRTYISLRLCQRLAFNQPNGWPKERAMRDILRRLENQNLIRLPPSLKRSLREKLKQSRL